MSPINVEIADLFVARLPVWCSHCLLRPLPSTVARVRRSVASWRARPAQSFPHVPQPQRHEPQRPSKAPGPADRANAAARPSSQTRDARRGARRRPRRTKARRKDNAKRAAADAEAAQRKEEESRQLDCGSASDSATQQQSSRRGRQRSPCLKRQLQGQRDRSNESDDGSRSSKEETSRCLRLRRAAASNCKTGQPSRRTTSHRWQRPPPLRPSTPDVQHPQPTKRVRQPRT